MSRIIQPDRRNLWHQKYCSKPSCRQASKAASQRRWLAKPENRDYFRDPAHVERVRAWRAAHPRYWQRSGRQSCLALQEDCLAQVAETQKESTTLAGCALQEIFAAQPLVLLGLIANLTGSALIANLTGSALQEDIAQHSRRLVRLGQDILGGTLAQKGGHHGRQTSAMPRAGP